jgi:uncharacterized membrane protein
MSVIRRAMVIVMVLCGVALAAPSGGSVGGGSWSGGGGASRGGGGGGGWSGGGTGVAYSATHVSTQPTSGDWRGIALLMVGLAVIAVVVMVQRRPRTWRGRPRGPHVAVLHIAFAPAARTALTAALREIARDAKPARAEGRAALVHELSLLLRRHVKHAAYLGYEFAVAANLSSARSQFQRHALAARARFVEERIRNDGKHVVEQVAPTVERERSGFTVVTLVLVTGAPLLGPVRDRASLDAGLRQLGNVLPFAMIACEVIWMPADRGEALSSLVVEDRLPHLTKLPGAIAAPCECAYCGALYPIEDAMCPRCGAHPLST